MRFLILWMAGWLTARQLEVIAFLGEENRVLGEQLDGRRLRFTDDQRRRLGRPGQDRRSSPTRPMRGPGHARHDPALVSKLIDRKYDGSARRRIGRPIVAAMWKQLIVRTVKRVLLRYGHEPGPTRGKRMPWKTSLHTQLGAIAAADFSCVFGNAPV